MEYVQILKEEFNKRRAKNERYSIRAFAKYLGVQSATLSAVLNKNRHLSFKDAEAISLRLFQNPEESRKFIVHFLQERALETQYQFLPEDPHYFPVIAEWEYRAVLTLMDTADFQPSADWISKRLQITLKKTNEVLAHLKKIGLISKDGSGQWTKALTFAETSDDVSSLAIKHAHQNELHLALKKQQEVEPAEREFQSLCFAVEKKNIPKMKKQIREFIRQLEKTFETKEADEVYFFTSQLFPLTQEVSDEK